MDKYDLKILRELEKIDKINYTLISKQIGRSKGFVKFRLDKLIKEQLVSSPKLTCNYMEAGYSAFHIYCQLKNQIKTDWSQILLNNKGVEYYQFYLGNYQLGIFYKYSELNTYISFLSKLQSLLTITLIDILPIKKYQKFPNNFVYDEYLQKSNLCSDNFPDSTLINKYINNKLTYYKINQIRKKYPQFFSMRLHLNYSKLGFTGRNLLIKTNESEKCYDFLSKQRSIVFLSQCFGRYNLTAQVIFKTQDEYIILLEELQKYGVQEIIQLEEFWTNQKLVDY